MKKENLLKDACKIAAGGCIGLAIGAVIMHKMDAAYEEIMEDTAKFDNGMYIRVKAKIYVPDDLRTESYIKLYEEKVIDKLNSIQEEIFEEDEEVFWRAKRY